MKKKKILLTLAVFLLFLNGAFADLFPTAGDGNLFVIGQVNEDMYSWDGSVWAKVATNTDFNGLDRVYHLCGFDGNIVALGENDKSGDILFSTDAITWAVSADGAVLSEVQSWACVQADAELDNNLFAATAGSVWSYNGKLWNESYGSNGGEIIAYHDGNVWVGNTAASYIKRFNGSDWVTTDEITAGQKTRMLGVYDGVLYGGDDSFDIKYWNGVSWVQSIDLSTLDGAATKAGKGNVECDGNFYVTMMGADSIATFDGTSWHDTAFGGSGAINAYTQLACRNGYVYVATSTGANDTEVYRYDKVPGSFTVVGSAANTGQQDYIYGLVNMSTAEGVTADATIVQSQREVNERAYMRVELYDNSTYSGVTPTAWAWFLDDVLYSIDQNAFLDVNYSGNYAIDFRVNATDGFFSYYSDYNTTVTVTIDTVDPVIVDWNISYQAPGIYQSIELGDDANATMLCTDNNSAIISYFFQVGDVNVIDANYASGTTVNLDFNAPVGSNSVYIKCTDAAGNYASDSNVTVFYGKEFVLVDEIRGGRLDLDDINGLIAYSPDNNNIYDFKTSGDTNVTYISGSEDDGVRFELTYTDATGSILKVRNFSLSVLDANSIPVCIPPIIDSVIPTFYSHYLLSSQQRSVAMYNPYTQCYIIAGFTKFGYQTNYISQVDLLDMQYELYVWSDGAKVTLGLIDGSVESTINLDALEYSITEYDIGVAEDELHISKPAGYDSTIKIYYRNLKENNAIVKFEILDGSTSIWTYTETASPNDVNLLFDYSTLTINNDMLTVTATKTLLDGSEETITKYFTLAGVSGVLSPVIAVVIAFIIVIFALTFVSYSYALGWFGIIGCMIGIGVLTFATPVWYVVFAQAGLIISIIYIALIYRSETVAVT